MADDRLILVHVPTGEAVVLGKLLGLPPWHTWSEPAQYQDAVDGFFRRTAKPNRAVTPASEYRIVQESSDEYDEIVARREWTRRIGPVMAREWPDGRGSGPWLERLPAEPARVVLGAR